MRVTYAQVAKWGACDDQVSLAVMHFGRSVVLTRSVLMEAAALGLDISFLARRILTPEQYDTYEKAHTPLWADLARAVAPARADLDRATASALADALNLPVEATP